MINYIKKLTNKLTKAFRPLTVEVVVEDIFDKLDQLEVVSEQQEMRYDQIVAQIAELVQERNEALNEQMYAERVAAKLRALVTEEA
jgi:ribosomal 50S subunit-associated protein YjgA (DUF615 family)